jgi:hypothetical protein
MMRVSVSKSSERVEGGEANVGQLSVLQSAAKLSTRELREWDLDVRLW